MTANHFNTIEAFYGRLVEEESPSHLVSPCLCYYPPRGYKPNRRKGNRDYPKFGWLGKKWRTHRLAYMLHYGEIPQGMSILHECDNPYCCNPEHLRAGTHRENMDDRIKRRKV